MKDTIIEIMDRNQEIFTGSNEANLHAAEEIQKLIKSREKAACEALLDSLSKGFLSNVEKVDWNDKPVFQAIGETIKNYPISEYKP